MTDIDRRHDTTEAAAYLTAHGYRVAPATLTFALGVVWPCITAWASAGYVPVGVMSCENKGFTFQV